MLRARCRTRFTPGCPHVMPMPVHAGCGKPPDTGRSGNGEKTATSSDRLQHSVLRRLSTCCPRRCPRPMWKTPTPGRGVVPGSARQLSGQIATKPRCALAGQSPALRSDRNDVARRRRGVTTNGRHLPEDRARSAGLCPAALRPDRDEAALRARRAEPGATVRSQRRRAAPARRDDQRSSPTGRQGA